MESKRCDNKKKIKDMTIWLSSQRLQLLLFWSSGWKVKAFTISSEVIAIKNRPFMRLRKAWEGERVGVFYQFSLQLDFSFHFPLSQLGTCHSFLQVSKSCILSMQVVHKLYLSFCKYVSQADVHKRYCWRGFLPFLSAFLLDCNLKDQNLYMCMP